MALTLHDVSVPCEYSRNLKGEKFSIGGLTALRSVCQLLQYRIKEGFLSLKMQEILCKVKIDRLEKEADLSVK